MGRRPRGGNRETGGLSTPSGRGAGSPAEDDLSGHPDAEVLAAGGVVRRGENVLLVHRPKYGDWTFPKGKLDPGESFEDAALREVEEETGLCCELGEELEATTYHDRHGRLKLVRYWEMEVVGGEFEPNDEVDEVRWVTPEEARRMLSYERDRELV